ncbi:phosphocholine cytidylyltransferase family protein [Paenibacillus glycinis]|uniref:NTP transferase domain-containing protein n=1 Tax=Paenibacillus glycinis TaxID=2697035 RepID=A0ABW9XT44_9BACL|nr:phosphocholine cytidylyltransferase family protein [Paenibacillus glycinis]NBD25526.1 NTP transferase domain-containing protein [Paenibacillus glycinis]
MKAIILAAGRGSRMGDRTDNTPKCMTELWGRTLIEWQIKILRDSGINEIGVVVGYLADKIKLEQVHFFHNQRWENSNIVRSLLSSKDWLENDDCIIAYSDILYTPNTIRLLINNHDEISIPYKTNYRDLWEQRFINPLSDLETFKTSDHSILLEIGNPAVNLDEIEGQFMGLLKTTPSGFRKLSAVLNSLNSEALDQLDVTAMLAILLKYNIQVSTIPCDDFWIEVDSLQDIRLYESWEHGFK